MNPRETLTGPVVREVVAARNGCLVGLLLGLSVGVVVGMVTLALLW